MSATPEFVSGYQTGYADAKAGKPDLYPPAPPVVVTPPAPAPPPPQISVGPTQTVVNLTPGQDIYAALKIAKPYTTLLNAQGAPITCNDTALLIAGQDHITVDGNGGTITCKPSVGSSAIFGIVGAQYFTFKNFNKVTATLNATLFNVKSAYASILNNKNINTVQQFCIFQNDANYFLLQGNQTLGTESYACFVNGVHDGQILYNNFATSVGESTVRTVNATNADGSITRTVRIKIAGNTLIDHNSTGKPPLQLRGGDFITVTGNTFDGWLRIGEPNQPSPTTCCASFIVSANTFINALQDNAIGVYGGSTGSINGNTGQPTATVVSMFAVASNNNVTISNNTAQVIQGTPIKPIIAPTSDPHSYHDDGTNHVVIVPKAA